MIRYDSLIFDLDGTLWDAAETSAKGWNVALESQGFGDKAVSADDVRRVSGMPFDACVRTLFPESSLSSGGDLFQVLDAGERSLIEHFAVEHSKGLSVASSFCRNTIGCSWSAIVRSGTSMRSGIISSSSASFRAGTAMAYRMYQREK